MAMERALTIRSLSTTTAVASTLMLSSSAKRGASRLSKIPYGRHRSLSSTFSNHFRCIPIASSGQPFIHHLHKHFSPLSTRAIATSSASPPDVLAADDDVAANYGFEKVCSEFIEECKSKAVLYKHKKTGAEIMSLSNDDENKCSDNDNVGEGG